MPQTPRRNSQTTPNWAEKNRYAAGAVVALLAAYLVAGRGEPPSSIPPGVTLIHGLEALAPPRPKGAAPLGGKWPLDVLDPVAPKAGTLVIYANVKRDDYLAPEPRTRHAHRALADGAPHHVHACVEIKFTRVPLSEEFSGAADALVDFHTGPRARGVGPPLPLPRGAHAHVHRTARALPVGRVR